MTEAAQLIGYWFRFGRKSKTLHVAKWELAPELTVTAACHAALMVSHHDPEPATLNLAPTPAKAVEMADQNQRRHLCARCGSILRKAGQA